MDKLDWIAGQEYLGRGILIGRAHEGSDLISYFVTGRGPSSRARRLDEQWSKGGVRTECTDDEQLRKGTPELLIYNAITRVNDVFVVSNGGQTDIIAKQLRESPGRSPGRILMDSFEYPVWVAEMKDSKFTGNYIDLTSFEPDSPNYTPRISGVVMADRAALSIARNLEGQAEMQYFEFPLIKGRAKFISTYSGRNVPSGEIIPGFRGEPLDIELPVCTQGRYDNFHAMLIYGYLGPKTEGANIVSPDQDFRVGVSTVLIQRQPRPSITTYTKNAIEPKVAGE